MRGLPPLLLLYWWIRTRILKSRLPSTSQSFVPENQLENESNRKVLSRGCLISPLLRQAKHLEKCWYKDPSQTANVKIRVCQITLVFVNTLPRYTMACPSIQVYGNLVLPCSWDFNFASPMVNKMTRYPLPSSFKWESDRPGKANMESEIDDF